MSNTDPYTTQQVRVGENPLESGHGKRRPKRPRPKPDGIKECQEKLSKDAGTIQILERLSDRGAQHVKNGVEIMTAVRQYSQIGKIRELPTTALLNS